MISLLVVALVLFLLVRQYNRVRDRCRTETAPAAPTEEASPRCRMTVPVDATRCPHCTSDLPTD